MLQDVGFSHGEVPIENIEKLAFDTTDVASTEYPRTQGPVISIVLDGPVVNILWIPHVEPIVSAVEGDMKLCTDLIDKYERPQEDTLTGPFWGLDEEVFLCSLDVYQRD